MKMKKQKAPSKCPFFEEMSFRYCKAMAKRIMIPSRTEKEKFCDCEKYHECLIYKEWKKNRRKNGYIFEKRNKK